MALNAQERLEARRMLGRGHFAQIVGSAFQPAVLPSFHAPLLPRLDSILQLGSVDGDLTRTRSYQNFSRSLEIFGNHVMQVVRANDEDCPTVLNLILDRILDFSDDIVCDHWPTSLRLYFNAIIDQRRCKKAKACDASAVASFSEPPDPQGFSETAISPPLFPPLSFPTTRELEITTMLYKAYATVAVNCCGGLVALKELLKKRLTRRAPFAPSSRFMVSRNAEALWNAVKENEANFNAKATLPTTSPEEIIVSLRPRHILNKHLQFYRDHDSKLSPQLCAPTIPSPSTFSLQTSLSTPQVSWRQPITSPISATSTPFVEVVIEPADTLTSLASPWINDAGDEIGAKLKAIERPPLLLSVQGEDQVEAASNADCSVFSASPKTMRGSDDTDEFDLLRSVHCGTDSAIVSVDQGATSFDSDTRAVGHGARFDCLQPPLAKEPRESDTHSRDFASGCAIISPAEVAGVSFEGKTRGSKRAREERKYYYAQSPESEDDDDRPGNSVAAKFPTLLRDIVSDPKNSEIIRWDDNLNGVIILDATRLSQTVLPLHFKSKRGMKSFSRQLNYYGFRSIRAPKTVVGIPFRHARYLVNDDETIKSPQDFNKILRNTSQKCKKTVTAMRKEKRKCIKVAE